MHDRNGTELKVGDVVTVRYKITSVSPGAHYCNISAESVEKRIPDDARECFFGNSHVCVLQERAAL